MNARTPPPKGQPDRRKTGRLALSGETHCQFGVLTDLSKGGCKVRSRKPVTIPKGATVNLKLECDGASIPVPARPIASKKRSDGGYDVCFQFQFTDENMEKRVIAFARTARASVEYALKPTA